MITPVGTLSDEVETCQVDEVPSESVETSAPIRESQLVSHPSIKPWEVTDDITEEEYITAVEGFRGVERPSKGGKNPALIYK